MEPHATDITEDPFLIGSDRTSTGTTRELPLGTRVEFNIAGQQDKNRTDLLTLENFSRRCERFEKLESSRSPALRESCGGANLIE